MLFRSGKMQGLNGGEAAQGAVTDSNFLNQDRPVPMGMQRFLSKKGINSAEDLMQRYGVAPKMRLFKPGN